LRIHLEGAKVPSGPDPAGVRRFLRGVLRGEGLRNAGITVVFTDDAGIRALNARFRDRDGATDVLAFPFSEDADHQEDLEPGAGPYLGDVVVSLDRARAQAPRFHNTSEAELARLLAHGCLHLLGYDHHRPADGRRMKAAERRALDHYLPGSLWESPGPAAV